jgi:hypothetical protein
LQGLHDNGVKLFGGSREDRTYRRWAFYGSVRGQRRTTDSRPERWWRAPVARLASTATLEQSSWRWQRIGGWPEAGCH